MVRQIHAATRRSLALLFASSVLSAQAVAQTMPRDFVALADVAPSIAEDMRYATPQNFTGAMVPGYVEGSTCVLRRATANALALVAQDLAQRGYGLKVFDCYRPMRAVAAFMAWTKSEPNATGRYHPGLRRSELVASGYIAAVSGHSRGNVVDLTLIRIADDAPTPETASQPSPCTSTPTSRGELDLGTEFDCFSSRANYGAPGISREAIENRRILRTALERRGFSAYSREWWHFSFNDGNSERFDFPVPARK